MVIIRALLGKKIIVFSVCPPKTSPSNSNKILTRGCYLVFPSKGNKRKGISEARLNSEIGIAGDHIKLHQLPLTKFINYISEKFKEFYGCDCSVNLDGKMPLKSLKLHGECNGYRHDVVQYSGADHGNQTIMFGKDSSSLCYEDPALVWNKFTF